MRVLKVIYVLAIAALLILLVIVGVQAFYPAPQYPDCYELLGPQPDYGSPDYEDWMQGMHGGLRSTSTGGSGT